jgi:hypothetical protein
LSPRAAEPALTLAPGGFRLRVRLTPKAASDAVEGPGADAAGAAFLKVRVRAAPEKGAANAALEAALAKALGVAKSAVQVERGATGRVKIVAVNEAGALERAKTLLGMT